MPSDITISFMYYQMWHERKCSPSYFSPLLSLSLCVSLSLSLSLSLYACKKQIFLKKEDIPLHIQFLKLVYSQGKIT